MLAEHTISTLLKRELILRPIDFSSSLSIRIDFDVVARVCEALGNVEAFDQMQWAPKPACLGMMWQKATTWIIRVVAYSWVVSPSTFELKEVVKCVNRCLGHPEKVDWEDGGEEGGEERIEQGIDLAVTANFPP